MELRKVWFPLLLAAIWVAMAAATLYGFAGFNAATKGMPETVQAKAKAKTSVGRRGQPRSDVRRFQVNEAKA